MFLGVPKHSGRQGMFDDSGVEFENDIDCTFCKHQRFKEENGKVWAECELNGCEYEEMEEPEE